MDYPDELKIKMDHAAAQRRAETFNDLEAMQDKLEAQKVPTKDRMVWPFPSARKNEGIGGA